MPLISVSNGKVSQGHVPCDDVFIHAAHFVPCFASRSDYYASTAASTTIRAGTQVTSPGMRRTTKKILVNFSLFGLALLFILYLNRSGRGSRKTFDWTTIRYQTTASKPPDAYGVCPGLATSAKAALVVARVAADGASNWTATLAERYHLCIYTADEKPKDGSTVLRIPANRAHEAIPYLTYIVDNYDALPEASVFVHGSRFAWHNDHPVYDNLPLLQNLNVAAALSSSGYHNLRCDWSAGTCPPSTAPQGSLETSMNAGLEPWNQRAVSDAALPSALLHLFGNGKDTRSIALGRSDAVRSQCCAQFVVARENIYQHSRDGYVALRQWLLDDGLNSAPKDDRIAGRVVSYLWHVLFLPRKGFAPRSSAGVLEGIDLNRLNDMACPSAADCYCRLYGRCDLQHCTTKESCAGQYEVPKDFKLPADWAARHGG
ncbi:hypothetical protein B0A48_00176 [Cryoendolithus antarcticus]|uniref:Uncharacterized protein n=1 Tax=Cryoendolithus antarcticus TaxID=1507870 RepID=A0A1V8TU10_9PEZI|nr:hypothetical protein B0A48_00176 [Cryoendolithus antarcticus]